MNGKTAIILIYCFIQSAAVATGAELNESTRRSWDAYLATVESTERARTLGQRSFLWIDDDPSRAARVRKGEVLVEMPDGHGPKAVPSGLIHDWIAAVFIPNTSMREVLRLVQDYDRYQALYKPEVASSRTLSRVGDCQRFSMRWRRKVMFIVSVYDTEHESEFRRIDERRWQSVDRTVTVQEVENPGQPTERRLPPGQGSGYLWSVRTITRYEERDGGVYMEMQTIALSRDVPAVASWLVTPLLQRLPREVLRRSMEKTRDAVQTPQEAGN